MHKDIKEILYTEEEIKAKCDELAKQIDQDYAGQEILLVGLLKVQFHLWQNLLNI